MYAHGRQKDDAAGEVPVAFVVRAADSDIAEDAIKEYISKQVFHSCVVEQHARHGWTTLTTILYFCARVCPFSGGVLQEAAQGVLHPLHPQVSVGEDTEERAAGQARRSGDRLSSCSLRPLPCYVHSFGVGIVLPFSVCV